MINNSTVKSAMK